MDELYVLNLKTYSNKVFGISSVLKVNPCFSASLFSFFELTVIVLHTGVCCSA